VNIAARTRRLLRLTAITAYIFIPGLLILSGCGQEKAEKPATEPAAETSAVLLNERLSELRANISAQAPPELLEIGARQMTTLKESGILEKALNVGDAAPAFELPNAVGTMIASSDILAVSPMVLVFYRGVW
jgi:hypothetical protein